MSMPTVDLPEPFLPRRPVIDPGSILKDTWSTTFCE